MFKELAPYLRQRAVLLTVTHIENDLIRVVIVPQKLKDGENSALTTPLSVTGTAEEIDRELPSSIVSFVGSHLQLKNTLDRAKEEMDEAAKAAKAEARSKAKNAGKGEPPKVSASTTLQKPVPSVKTEPPPPASLFDAVPAETATSAEDGPDDKEDEEESRAGIEEQEDGGESEDAA